jgi:hypothetical protein
MSNSTPSECYLFSCWPDKDFCYILQCAYKTQLSMNTLYEMCASHMQYFITLSIHQNFNPCINPTSLMDMPIPIGTFHSMSLITETYATYIHIYTFHGWFVKQLVFCPLTLLPSFTISQANIIWSAAALLWYNSNYWQQSACIWRSLWRKNGNTCVHFKTKKYIDN